MPPPVHQYLFTTKAKSLLVKTVFTSMYIVIIHRSILPKKRITVKNFQVNKSRIHFVYSQKLFSHPVVCKSTWHLQVRPVQVRYLQMTCYNITGLYISSIRLSFIFQNSVYSWHWHFLTIETWTPISWQRAYFLQCVKKKPRRKFLFKIFKSASSL